MDGQKQTPPPAKRPAASLSGALPVLRDADVADAKASEWRDVTYNAIAEKGGLKEALSYWHNMNTGMEQVLKGESTDEEYVKHVDAVQRALATADDLPKGHVVWHNTMLRRRDRLPGYVQDLETSPVWFATSSSAEKAARFKATSGLNGRTVVLMRVTLERSVRALPVNDHPMDELDRVRSTLDEDEILFDAGPQLVADGFECWYSFEGGIVAVVGYKMM